MLKLYMLEKVQQKDSKAVTSIGKGTPVRVTGESGDWYKVEVSDGKGYVMKQFLSK